MIRKDSENVSFFDGIRPTVHFIYNLITITPSTITVQRGDAFHYWTRPFHFLDESRFSVMVPL